VSIKNEQGFVLLEVLIAIAIIGVIAAGFLGAMHNATTAALKTDRIDTARTLAEGQMEYIKQLGFATSYSPGDLNVYDSIHNQFFNYPGYSATITTVNAAQRDANIQKVTVTIKYMGSTVLTLDDCKAN
jgi:prepilin-type N-terminal cleavage/methylation domain-containing protein